MKPTHKMWTMLLLAVLCLVAGIAASLKIYQHIATSYSEQRHTLLVIDLSEDFLLALKDAETGERGYVITGNEAFLRPSLAVRESMEGRLHHLQQLVKTDARIANVASSLQLAGRFGHAFAAHTEHAGHSSCVITSSRSGSRSMVSSNQRHNC